MPNTHALPATALVEPDESAVATYERLLRDGRAPALADYVPPPGAPHRLATLVELVRGDLEWRWARGARKPAADYLREFPELAAAGPARAAVAFEEYRARVASGDPADPEEYRDRLDVPVDSWPVLGPPAGGAAGGAAGATVRQAIAPVVSPAGGP